MRTASQNAQLAMLLEVCGTPKPGNVDRRRDLETLRFEHFLAGAIGAQRGLEMAADGAAIGPAFERAVAGMANQGGGNTQFGSLLLLVPLVRASRRDLSRPACASIVEGTTVADAAAFYRSFEHVDVFVGDPPAEAEPLDVRRGADAVTALEERGLALYDVMKLSVPGDDVAREWCTDFERSFATADRIADADGAIEDRAARAFLAALAERPDTLVAEKHGESVASETSERAGELLESGAFDANADAIEAFADELVAREVNPGTTADIVAAGLYIALEREAIDV